MCKGMTVAATLAVGLAFAAPAAAQPVLNTSTQTIPLIKGGTATFGNTPGSGTFLDTFLFQVPQAGRVTVSLFSQQTGGPRTNVNFVANGVKFNGQNLSVISRGVIELQELVNQTVNAGVSTLSIRGASGPLGSYTGSISYAIPEPAMWALMILGFGFTGAALRSKRTRVRFAKA